METTNPKSERLAAASPLLERAKRVGVEVAGPAASDVDRNARHPVEALEAMKREKLLSCYVPTAYGGGGCSFSELYQICEILGQHCTATAMVFAMHQIQVACIVHHELHHPYFQQYLVELCERQLLMGSMTSETGIGGDMRSSLTHLERLPNGTFTLNKDSSTSSYAAIADDILVTARRNAEAPKSDQVLVLVRRADFTAKQNGTWDTLGLRGTCSAPFLLTSKGNVDQVFSVPFAEIAAQTMVPYSHILWAGAWTGLGTDAVRRARAFVRGLARKQPGTVPPQALRVAEVASMLQTMRTNAHEVAREFDAIVHGPNRVERLSTISFALKMNNLKLSTSEMIVQVVHRALLICGMAAYKNESKFALGRHMRDSIAAALMVGNDRIYATNAALHLVYKDE